jgi:hypothetical protein
MFKYKQSIYRRKGFQNAEISYPYICDEMSTHYHANPSLVSPEQVAALRSPRIRSKNNLIRRTGDTENKLNQYGLKNLYIQEVGISSLQIGEAQRSLHVYLYHLQSVSCRRTHSVALLVSVLTLIAVVPPFHTDHN